MNNSDDYLKAWNNSEHPFAYDFWNKISKSYFNYMLSSFEENKFLIDFINKIPEISILDYGCSSGYIKKFINLKSKKKFKYNGVDISRASIQLAKKNYGEKYFFTVDEFNAKKNEDKKFDLVYSRDTVLHQKNPWEFLDKLISHTKNSIILRLRTRDKGDTILDIEKSCQLSPGEIWVPYIVLNYQELIDYLKNKNFKFIQTNRSYMKLGGEHSRYLDKSLYLKETASAETSIIASYNTNSNKINLIEKNNLEGHHYLREKKLLTYIFKIFNKFRI